MRYRKKPIVIDAFKYGSKPEPEWFIDAIGDGIDADNYGCTIETMEGIFTANIGDWIIKGIKGEIYSCNPEIFEATYELVEE